MSTQRLGGGQLDRPAAGCGGSTSPLAVLSTWKPFGWWLIPERAKRSPKPYKENRMLSWYAILRLENGNQQRVDVMLTTKRTSD
jgi:hypothetical protein